jgi:hypothetical protein
MTIDLVAASAFMTSHARLLDRRRFAVRFAAGKPEQALAALDAYRNADGGYGALEPDLRAEESQPAGALHAFEVFEDVGPTTTPRAAELCDWLTTVTLPDGGLPFALPIAETTATAPFWADADPAASSLHISAAVAAPAVRVARHDPAVARHPWLATITQFCLDAIAARERPATTLELRYALEFLDAVTDVRPDAVDLLDGWASILPPSATLPVEGGLEDEVIRPHEFSPLPGGKVREHVAPDVIDADLDRLAGEQQEDGGWKVDYTAYSPAAALEWRGYVTVRNLTILQANGRLSDVVSRPRASC